HRCGVVEVRRVALDGDGARGDRGGTGSRGRGGAGDVDRCRSAGRQVTEVAGEVHACDRAGADRAAGRNAPVDSEAGDDRQRVRQRDGGQVGIARVLYDDRETDLVASCDRDVIGDL